MTYFVRMNTYYRRVLKGGRVGLPTYREAREAGASRAELVGFTIERASVQLSGASRADLTVTDLLSDVDLSGASKLVYHGGPSLGGISTSVGATVESR